MDDKRVEKILKESWSPNPPDGMRERILRRGREELAPKRRIPWITNWKPVLAAAAVLLVILTNFSDYRSQARISALMDGSQQRITVPQGADSLLAQRRRMEELLVRLPSNGDFEKEEISL